MVVIAGINVPPEENTRGKMNDSYRRGKFKFAILYLSYMYPQSYLADEKLIHGITLNALVLHKLAIIKLYNGIRGYCATQKCLQIAKELQKYEKGF